MKTFILTIACLGAAFSGLTSNANAYGCYYRYRPVSYHCPVYHYHQHVWHPSARIFSLRSG